MIEINDEFDLCATMLRFPETLPEIRAQLLPDDFSAPVVRTIFRAACSLFEEDRLTDDDTISLVNLVDRIHEQGDDIAYQDLFDLSLFPVQKDTVTEYVARVKDKLSKKKLLSLLMDTVNELSAPYSSTTPDIVVRLQERLQAFTRSGFTELITPEEQYAQYIRRIDMLEHGECVCVSTKMNALDKALGAGLAKGSLIVIGGRPGHGKSTVGLDLADNVASQGLPVLFISMEMPSEQLWARRVSRLTGIPHGKLLWNRDTLTPEELSEEARVSLELSGVPLFLHTGRVSVQDVNLLYYSVYTDRKAPSGTREPGGEADTRALAPEDLLTGCELIVIDYLGLMKYEPGNSTCEQVTRTSNRLKQLAIQLNIPIVVLVQLNREKERRGGGPTLLSDIRDSGAIEQDADVVMFLDPSKEDDGSTLTLTIAKNRHGPAGQRLDLYWDRSTCKIIPYEE